MGKRDGGSNVDLNGDKNSGDDLAKEMEYALICIIFEYFRYTYVNYMLFNGR